MVSRHDYFAHARMLHREHLRHEPAFWTARSSRGMIASAHYLATAAGAEAFRDGGNAVDAVVTAALALGVCESAGSGLGGMAMMLVHLAEASRTVAIEGPCLAPREATPEVVARSPRYHGYRAIAVPTNLAVLAHALECYGKLDHARVLAPAIELAEAGFPVTLLQHEILLDYHAKLRKSTAAPFFLDERSNPRPPGSCFRQPVLASTLRRLSDAGFEDFYHGEIARSICADMQEHGGLVRREDLSDRTLYRESEPVCGSFRRDSVATMGPPAGGMALIEMLHLIDAAAVGGDIDPDSPQGVVRIAAVIRQARRDRLRFRLRVGADGVGEAGALLDPSRARRKAREMLTELANARGVAAAPLSSDGGETSHVSAMDAQGNVVTLTQSIERSFGSGVVTPDLGFVYNGYLRAFKVRNRKHPHYLRPGAPARSNAAPTITFRDGRPRAALGSTGSERMVSGIFQVLVRLARQPPFDAVHAPRLHCTPEGHVLWEEARFPEGSRQALLGHGFTVEALDAYSFKTGGLQLVVRDGDTLYGVAEPRRDGAAAGPELLAGTS